jgi:transcriptional regulator with XRE-family HTH domain
MPTRPSQTSPSRLQAWQKRREQVGARIRELRLAQDLSQEALGLEAGLHRSMVIGLEWGRRSIAYERLWDLADVLGVDVTELFIEASDIPKVEHQSHGSARSSTKTRLSVEPS